VTEKSKAISLHLRGSYSQGMDDRSHCCDVKVDCAAERVREKIILKKKEREGSFLRKKREKMRVSLCETVRATGKIAGKRERGQSKVLCNETRGGVS